MDLIPGIKDLAFTGNLKLIKTTRGFALPKESSYQIDFQKLPTIDESFQFMYNGGSGFRVTSAVTAISNVIHPTKGRSTYEFSTQYSLYILHYERKEKHHE